MYRGVTRTMPGGRSAPASSGLYEILDLILDKGLVIDAYVRVSLVGIEVLTVDARVIIASVDTYLRWADAVDRLQLGNEPRDLTDLLSPGAGSATREGTRQVGDKSRGLISRLTGSGKEEEEQETKAKK